MPRHFFTCSDVSTCAATFIHAWHMLCSHITEEHAFFKLQVVFRQARCVFVFSLFFLTFPSFSVFSVAHCKQTMSRHTKAPKLAVKGHFINLLTVVQERNSLDNTKPLWTPGAFSQFPWNRRFVADQEYLMQRGIQDWKCDMTVCFQDANISKFSKTTIEQWSQPKPASI